MEGVRGLNGVAAAVPDGSTLAVRPLPGLHKEALLHPGDGQAVVEALPHEARKVIAGLRGLVREEHGLEHPRRGIKDGDGVPRRRVGELQLGRFHRRAADALALPARAAGQARQPREPGAPRQRQRRQSQRPRLVPSAAPAHKPAPCVISFVWDAYGTPYRF